MDNKPVFCKYCGELFKHKKFFEKHLESKEHKNNKDDCYDSKTKTENAKLKIYCS